MKELIVIFVLAQLSLVTHAAGESQFTAKVLRDSCSAARNSSGYSVCIGYIRGYVSGYLFGAIDAVDKTSVLKDAKSDGKPILPRYMSICFDPNVHADQLAEMFVKLMNNIPEKLHFDADMMFTSMLMKEFPCNK